MGFVEPLKRKFMLAMLDKQTPEKLQALSRKRLPKVFAHAAENSEAYAELLREHGVTVSDCRSPEDVLANAPVLEKSDLFERFSLKQLVQRNIDAAQLAGVLTSSGHGGANFAFGVSTRKQMNTAPAAIDLGLEQAFGVDQRRTLLVNCLPMGVIFNSEAVCVANVSVREDMAFAILNQAGPLFEQVILCTDPLFSKRILDYAAEQQFDWSQLRMNVILGEEMFTEDYRSYLAKALHVPVDAPDGRLIGSSMGVGELGLNLFFETPETIALRRAHYRRAPDTPLPSFFCFNPLRSLVEVMDEDADGVGDLVISMLDTETPIPMLRYRTGDRARWLTDADLEPLDPEGRAAFESVPFPCLAVLGRAKDQINGEWHVDQFKALLYRDPALAAQFSGAFRISHEENRLVLSMQLARTASRPAAEIQWLFAEMLGASAASRGVSEPEVRVFEHAAFPFGMGLDYERKFRYYPGPAAGGGA